MQKSLPAIVLVFTSLCSACGPSTSFEDGGGGGVGEGAVAVALQSRGDQLRLVVGTWPRTCESVVGGLDALEECGTFGLQLFLPPDRLEVGPLFLTPDMRPQVFMSSGGSGDESCLRMVFTPQETHKVVIEDVTPDTVTVRLTGFGFDLDGDGVVETIDGSHSGPRCTLDEAPIELPTGQFVAIPGEPARLVGSTDGASCADPDQWSEECDTWTVEISLPPELLEPGTVADAEAEMVMQANSLQFDGSDSCGGGGATAPTTVHIESVTETEIQFVVDGLDFGTSTPIAGRYVAPICR